MVDDFAQLPPRAADGEGMKRYGMVGGVVVAALFVGSPALAADWKSEDSGRISVFADEPMGGGEVAQVQSPPAAKDAPVVTEPKVATIAAAGVVLEFGGGGSVLGGDIAKGASIGAATADVVLKAGYYPTQHVGLFAGIEAGTGSTFTGCDGCSASHFTVPVTVQLAFENRARGPYFEAGLAFLSTYKTAADDDNSIKMSSSADARFGVGYRIPIHSAFTGVASAVDLHLGADVGKFDSVSIQENGASSSSADINADARSIHYAVALNLGWHFAL